MDIITSKVIIAILFAIIRFVFGVLPIKVYLILKKQAGIRGRSAINDKKRARLEYSVLLVQAFGSGVIFATCFLRMMPEVRESLELVKGYSSSYPFSQLLISVGFFTVYMAEEIIHWWIFRETKERCQENSNSRSSSARSIISKNNKISPELIKIPNGMAFEIDKKELYDENEKYFQIEEDKKEANGGSENKSKDNDNVSVNTIVDSIDQEVQTDTLEEDLDSEIEEIVKEEVKTELKILRCFIMVIVLSFDTILEGLMIGLQESTANIWYLFAAVAVHSASILFCMSLEIQLLDMKEKRTMVQLWLLSGTTTVGVWVGVIISASTETHTNLKSWTMVILEGLSTGAILYLTFFEALNREKDRRMSRFVRAISMGIGFFLIAALQFLKEDVYD